jgi:prophage regulatory protein
LYPVTYVMGQSIGGRPVRLLRFSQLKSKGVSWSRMHVDRLEKQGKFPRRVHLGPATVAWVEEEIDQMLADKVAERTETTS